MESVDADGAQQMVKPSYQKETTFYSARSAVTISPPVAGGILGDSYLDRVRQTAQPASGRSGCTDDRGGSTWVHRCIFYSANTSTNSYVAGGILGDPNLDRVRQTAQPASGRSGGTDDIGGSMRVHCCRAGYRSFCAFAVER